MTTTNRSLRLLEMQTERAELRNKSLKRMIRQALVLASKAVWTMDDETKQSSIALLFSLLIDLSKEANKPLEQFHLEGEF